MKIAIIGSGIAGLTAAYSLYPHHEISVFERNDYIGGHARTIDVNLPNGTTQPVDTGFIVLNDRNYPFLLRLFAHAGVKIEKSDMSFGVSIGGGTLEYSSNNLLAQPYNLLKPAFWGMVADILRFNRLAPRYLEDADKTLGAAIEELKCGQWFRDYYLEAMGAAIWSCSRETIQSFPAASFIRFFVNHGLLTVFRQPQWYTVTGGSRAYIEKVTAGFRDRIHLSCGIVKIERSVDGVTLYDVHGGVHHADKVILACPANRSLSLLDAPDAQEEEILGAFRFQPNRIVVHGDIRLMPRRRGAWASWVYLNDHEGSVALSYWMNNLQNFDKAQPVIITLNPPFDPDPTLVYDTHHFDHPIFDHAAIEAQQKIVTLQGRRNCYYAGAWQRYGFHEDGVLSALRVLECMGESAQWL